jgi:hypothetical protein
MSTAIETKLGQLQAGDRLAYLNARWKVKEASTYADANGYETAEWLLRSPDNQEHYLLREVDPANPETIVHWYLAEEISNPQLFEPNSIDNTVNYLWEKMQQLQPPYPELRLFGYSYYLESQTEGNYQGQAGTSNRITWDYWDRWHQQNLAIEAWPSGELHVYLCKVVNPEHFSAIEKGAGKNSGVFPWDQLIAASIALIIGICLLIFG